MCPSRRAPAPTPHPPPLLAGRATMPRWASEREDNRPEWATQVSFWPWPVPLALDMKGLARGASRAAAKARHAPSLTVHPTGCPQRGHRGTRETTQKFRSKRPGPERIPTARIHPCQPCMMPTTTHFIPGGPFGHTHYVLIRVVGGSTFNYRIATPNKHSTA